MYAKANYHDVHYEKKEKAANSAYKESADLLAKFVNPGSLVLDYGCGTGGFLKALGSAGFVPFGVEFDADAAETAARHTGFKAISVESFNRLAEKPAFDVLHLGDVLEHLPDPAATLRELLGYLRHGGVLYVEGPLEINPSPVYLVAKSIGIIKRALHSRFSASHPPTHLFQVGEKQQSAFFKRIDPSLVQQFWRVSESGWPYIEGGRIKRIIAHIALRTGGLKIFGVTFGNRFQGLYIKK